MYGTDRTRLREVFFRAWHNYRAGRPLEGIEAIVVGVAREHPEYHAVLEAPERHGEQDFSPALGAVNPFLHLGMHITIEEQLSIDQPRGVRSHFESLRLRLADAHAAQHAMMDCLGEMLWRAQRDGGAPAESVYLDCLAERAAAPGTQERSD